MHLLPSEIIIQILGTLDPPEIIRISHTCQRLREIATDDIVWKQFISNTLESSLIKTYQLYFEIYEPFKDYIGYYQSDYPVYKGDLIQIEFQKSTSIDEPVLLISSIKVNGTIEQATQVPIEIPSMKFTVKRMYAVFVNKQGYCTLQHPITLEEDLVPVSSLHPLVGVWKDDTDLNRSNGTLQDSKYTVLQVSCQCPPPQIRTPSGIIEFVPRLSKLRIPRVCSSNSTLLVSVETRPKPGLWIGSYGGHGPEIVLVYYDNDIMFVTKVTGDVNVPRGQDSITTNFEHKNMSQLQLDGIVTPELQGQVYKAIGTIAMPLFTDPQKIEIECIND